MKRYTLAHVQARPCMVPSAFMKEPGPTKAQLREAAQTMSRKGNRKGGVNRWAGVSAEERREIARAAAKARWAKRQFTVDGT